MQNNSISHLKAVLVNNYSCPCQSFNNEGLDWYNWYELDSCAEVNIPVYGITGSMNLIIKYLM